MVSMKEYIIDLARTNHIIAKKKDILKFAKIIIENAFSFKEGKELNNNKECLKSGWCKAYMSVDYENDNYSCIESNECNDFIKKD